MNQQIKELIFGYNNLERIVSVEPMEGKLIIFKEMKDSTIQIEELELDYWFLTHDLLSEKQMKLNGNQWYRYMATFSSFDEKEAAKKKVLKSGYFKDNIYQMYDKKEASLVRNGMTYFKGMKDPSEISILSVDIESDGLKQTNNSEIYLITNTFRKQNKITQKYFDLSNFKNQKEMIDSWCNWVREVDPSIVIGHNFYMYDLPYLNHVAEINGTELLLGRDGSTIKFNTYESKKRKDGSQDYMYKKAWIFGREIICSLFMSIDYDIGRNFTSYALKQVVKDLGMEKFDRSYVDASQIKTYYKNRQKDPEMWQKVIQYGIEDSEDPIKLFDIMIPAKFFFTQSVSKSFQEMCTSASGSQLNNIMVRSYLQNGNSIAKSSPSKPFKGAISIGFPGFYKNVVRWDAAALYPSIMRQHKLYDKVKDPNAKFIDLVEYFTLERLLNKKLAKETGLQYYKDLEQTMKVSINSCYGFLGTPGLNYNYPDGAEFITTKGRELLERMIKWASGKTLNELTTETSELDAT